MSLNSPPRIPESGVQGILKVVLLYAAFSALWILLSDKAVEWLIEDPEKVTLASTFKGWLFVAVTSILLYGLMRRLPGHTPNGAKSSRAAGLKTLLPLCLIAIAIVVLTAGSVVYTYKHAKEKEASRLEAIADDKAGQLAAWLRERNGDAHFVQSSQFFADAYRRWKVMGDSSSGNVLREQLNEFRESRFFQEVLLLDENAVVLWGSEGARSVVHPTLQSPAPNQAVEGRPLPVGPYREANGRLHLDFVAPLLLAGTRPSPSVILCIDPTVYLFPTLQTWPVPSASGEILLFRQDGDRVLFLNEPRDSAGKAAVLSVPVANKLLPAAQLLRGEAKLGRPIEGVDHRGVPVMGVARAVPGTDWFLMAEVDLAELHAEPLRDVVWIVLTGLLALFMSAAGSFLMVQHRELASSLREREAQEEKLRALQLLDAIAEGSGDSIFAKDLQGRYLLFNREATRVTGKPSHEVLGRDDSAVFPPEQVAGILANDRKVMEDDRIVTFQEDLTTADGEVTFLATKGPLHDAEGNVVGMFGISRDITERRRAEITLKESEEKFRMAFETSPDSININRLSDGMYIDINEGFTKITGYTLEDVLGKTSLELNLWYDSRDRERLVATLQRQGFMENLEARFRTKSGRIITGLMSARSLRLHQEDVLLSITRDITQRKEAEEEKARLETQLFHSQKLESVGRLAGGVAHDFNNMLGVIIGHTELALAMANPMETLYPHLREIQKAAHRSADLTRQLLAFARRQTASPKVLDLNETISGMLTMLRRLIGEDITLSWMPGPNLWRVKVDPSQIDQILANLAVNARDAIPGTGSITLSTENTTLEESSSPDRADFPAGRYVLLTMNDTGSGMDRDVLEHIFEPFFTTKGVGQGTGLGLATVYGIVRQNNGFLNVTSTPRQGTTFRIYLPGLEAAATDAAPGESAETLVRGDETILVVEDDEGMLNLSRTILERLGYKVYAASSPAGAIRIVEECAEIDLLIADVVMPEMNGRELVERLRKIRPNLKYIHMSGYTADVIARRGVMEEGIHFIQKPFSVKEISRKIRQALND